MEDDNDVDEEEWEDVEDGDDDGEDIPVNDCLFCNHSSRDIEKNVQHMTREHSFFLPSIEFLVDVEGMLTYLGKFNGRGRRTQEFYP